MTQILFILLEYCQTLIWALEVAKKTLLSLTYKHSKLSHEMVLLTHFLPNCVFILVFTVFASIVSGFWLFSFKPPQK